MANNTNISNLPKDMINKLTEELSPNELINFCASKSSKNLVEICNSREFWLRRFQKDFGFLLPFYPEIALDPKKDYLLLFSKISQVVEKSTQNVLNLYGDYVKQFLQKEYKNMVYQYFYNLIFVLLRVFGNHREDIFKTDSIFNWINNREIWDNIKKMLPTLFFPQNENYIASIVWAPLIEDMEMLTNYVVLTPWKRDRL